MPTIPNTFSEEGRFERNPNDFYETPYACARGMIEALHLNWINEISILDPGCGTGVWGRAAKSVYPQAEVYGVDINADLDIESNELDDYSKVYRADYLSWNTERRFDLIIGNPPYSSKGNRNLAMNFVQKSLSLLAPCGVLAFLLKTEFLASVTRFEQLFRVNRPAEIYQSVDRINWGSYKNGNTIEYALFVWFEAQKPTKHTQLYWVKWKNVDRMQML